MNSLDEMLAGAPFFAGLPAGRIELIAGCGSNVQFEPGELIFREGEQADAFFLMRQGAVALEVHAPGAGRS